MILSICLKYVFNPSNRVAISQNIPISILFIVRLYGLITLTKNKTEGKFGPGNCVSKMF